MTAITIQARKRKKKTEKGYVQVYLLCNLSFSHFVCLALYQLFKAYLCHIKSM